MARRLIGLGEYHASERHLAVLPTAWSPDDAAPLCIVAHGWFSDAWSYLPRALHRDLEILAEAGFVVIVADLGGQSTWGNQTFLTRADSLIAWAVTKFGVDTTRVSWIADSMGATGALNWCARNPDQVGAIVLRLAAVNVDQLVTRDDPVGIAGAIAAAHGNDWPTARPLFDPVLNTALVARFADRILVEWSTDDPVMQGDDAAYGEGLDASVLPMGPTAHDVALFYPAIPGRYQAQFIRHHHLAAVTPDETAVAAEEARWLDLALTGTRFLLLPGTTGRFATTPDHASLDITGSLTLIADVSLDDWTPGSNNALLSKFNPSNANRSYTLRILTTGIPQVIVSNDGSANIIFNATAAPSVADGERLAIRADIVPDNGANQRQVTFFTAATVAGPWTQLGAVITQTGAISIFSGAALLAVGAENDVGGQFPVAGKVHAARVVNGSGTVVANPDFTIQTLGTTSFIDSAGKTWTLNGGAGLAETSPFVYHGGDITDSVELPGGEVVWIGSDLFVGNVSGDVFTGTPLPNDNGIIVADAAQGWSHQIYRSGMGGIAVLPNQTEHLNLIYWALACCLDGGLIRIACALVDRSIGTYGSRVDSHIVTLDPADVLAGNNTNVISVTKVNSNTEIFDVMGLTPGGDGWVYITGGEFVPSFTGGYGLGDLTQSVVRHRIARVPTGQLTSVAAWRYWDGSGWVAGQANAVPITDHDGDPIEGGDFGICRLGDDDWLGVDHQLVSDSVRYWRASGPEGPWHLRGSVPVPDFGRKAYSGDKIGQFARPAPHVPMPSGYVAAFLVPNILNGSGAGLGGQLVRFWVPRFVAIPV